MGHRTKVFNLITFCINLSHTLLYNANFDGNKMKLRVSQSLLACVEAKLIMYSL